MQCIVPEKYFTKQIPMYYIGVRDGKRKMEKEDKKSQHLGFLSHNILGHSQDVYKI